MTESKFTPGPWRVELEKRGSLYRPCIVADDTKIASVSRKEDAALITAAAEMYAELEDILNALENLPQFMPGVDFPAVFDKKIELRKLLRKARGESEVTDGKK